MHRVLVIQPYFPRYFLRGVNSKILSRRELEVVQKVIFIDVGVPTPLSEEKGVLLLIHANSTLLCRAGLFVSISLPIPLMLTDANV